MITDRRPQLLALAGGSAVALSLPPWGWWWAAPFGYAAFAIALRDASVRGRMASGAAFGFGCFAIGLAWMTEFTAPGTVIVVAMSALMSAAGAALVPPAGVPAVVAFPALVTLTETLRYRVPFGGLPLAGAALGQVGGPLVSVARIAGDLGLVLVTATIGVALAAAIRAPRRAGAAAAAVVVAIVALAAVSPQGRTVGSLRVAYVQGGGARGLRASENDATAVYQRHVDASNDVPGGLDIVLWPEDVIDIDQPIDNDPVRADISSLARQLGTTLVVGVVEDTDDRRFRNAAVAFDSSGNIVDRYDKVHRVPFGEYVPFRSLVARVADLSDVSRDAIPGKGPGVLLTRAAPLGVVISYEVFFADRARAAVNAGGEILLVPTNAASFRGRQVPSQEVAAARLRAVETSRTVVQAAPTGFSAFVDHRGRVSRRSVLGARQIGVKTVDRRRGTTWYVRYGDGPVLLIALGAAAGAWARRRRS